MYPCICAYFHLTIFSLFLIVMSDRVKVKVPSFTSAQRKFVMDRLAMDMPYSEIIEDFCRMYPYFCEPFDSDVLHKRLHDRFRKMKSEHKSELSAMSSDSESLSESGDADAASVPAVSSELLIPITCPYYRLRYLDRMLHDTPDVEVVSYDNNGNPKKKSNRSEKLKMLEMAERIFESMLGIDDAEVRKEVPRLVQTDIFASAAKDSEASDANS